MEVTVFKDGVFVPCRKHVVLTQISENSDTPILAEIVTKEAPETNTFVIILSFSSLFLAECRVFL